MMTLAAMAIDQPKPRDKVVEHILKYIHTDAAVVRYEPGRLATRQAQVCAGQEGVRCHPAIALFGIHVRVSRNDMQFKFEMCIKLNGKTLSGVVDVQRCGVVQWCSRALVHYTFAVAPLHCHFFRLCAWLILFS